ncbi:MAG: histone deacetylase, partial [Bacteroidales bacterium]
MIKIAFSHDYILPLPKGHRFPMDKYALIPSQLLYERSYDEKNFFIPEIMDVDLIQHVHDKDYVKKVLKGELSYKEIRRIGFPWSRQMVERELLIVYGSIQSAVYALTHGVSFNVAGGTHHAFTGHGEGFCIFNDIAVAAKYLIKTDLVQQILIVDLDVHQGNGTAAIFNDNSSIFTFSMHGAHNYPLRKEKSDMDIALDDGTTDGDYLLALERILPPLIEKVKPDFIFFQAGVDALNQDQLGKLSLSVQGLKNRDKFVFQTLLYYGIPVSVSMGGGYAKRLRDI